MKALLHTTIIFAFLFISTCAGGDRFLVIAHRGASGYLPEHTLAATALAIGMGADFVEQDVVLTRDGVPIVLHDIHLDTVTDVAERFPSRARENGRFFAIDFTLAEVKSLRVHERVDWKTGKPVFPKRFPVAAAHLQLRVPTLAESIELVQGINKSQSKTIGIYPEIKKPAWHRQAGHDISKTVLRVLDDFGYQKSDDAVYLQCFDAEELSRIRNELTCQLPLVQLIGENRWNEGPTDFDYLRSDKGLEQIATYANAIGPRIEHVLETDDQGVVRATGFADRAHGFGLDVHPFTLRSDALPLGISDVKGLVDGLKRAGCDGVFSDFPDLKQSQLESGN